MSLLILLVGLSVVFGCGFMSERKDSTIWFFIGLIASLAVWRVLMPDRNVLALGVLYFAAVAAALVFGGTVSHRGYFSEHIIGHADPF